ASLQRDRVEIGFELELEFHPLQISADALAEAVGNDGLVTFFWISLEAELSFRGIQTQDCFFVEAAGDTMKRRLQFLPADLELCRTNKALEKVSKKVSKNSMNLRKMSEAEFEKWLKSNKSK